MKNLKLSLVAIALIGTSSVVNAADTLADALTNGKTSVAFKAFYFDGDRDNRADRRALAVGGILKSVSAPLYGFKVGVAFYTSHDLIRDGADHDDRYGKLDTSDIGGSTEMVNKDGSSITVLGEAYLQYNTGNTMIKIGRQRLNTPLANDYYNRFLPNSFEALVIANSDIQDTTLLGAYVTKWKYKASDKFIGMTSNLGFDEDVIMLAAINKSIPNTKLQAYLYIVPDVLNALYLEAGNKKLVQFDGGSVYGAVQYLSEQDAGDAQVGELDTYLAGVKLGVKFKNGFSIKGMYDIVGDDTIVGSGTSYSTLGWSKFINFTDIQIDGEALNAGAESYGVVLGYDFGNGLKPAFKFVHVEQDAEKELASAFTGNRRPSSDEWNIDVKYKIDKQSKIRIRYANIDYDSNFFDAYGKSGNEFDEDNLRIIYDYKF